MFAHMTVAKMIPEKVGEAVRLIQQASCHLRGGEIRGLRGVLLLESQDEPGRMTWLTTWDSLQAAESFLSSPRYADLLAQVQDYLLRQPEWFRFSVLNEKGWELEGVRGLKGGEKGAFNFEKNE